MTTDAKVAYTVERNDTKTCADSCPMQFLHEVFITIFITNSKDESLLFD